jgi:protein O-GlcNAc transferase
MIQSLQLARPAFVEQILARLAAVGISAERVIIRGPMKRSDYLRSYCDVDVILDTFPFTGGTTTCEALWMGVPTLTLTGETMIARQGVAMMTAAGLADWVASDADDYVLKAVSFASNPAALSDLRKSLRERVRSSPMFDVQAFAKNFEKALADIWAERIARDADRTLTI